MADDKEVQELTIADESVLKKYKEAGEIVNSWVEFWKFPPKKSTRQRNNIKSGFYHSPQRVSIIIIACSTLWKCYQTATINDWFNFHRISSTK